MTITATQVLEMLAKARQLGIHYDVYDAEEYGHFIQFEVDWYGDDGYTYEKVFINHSNESDMYYGGWDVSIWMSMLDEKLEEQKKEELKKQKRQELLARLTTEEKELLGVK